MIRIARTFTIVALAAAATMSALAAPPAASAQAEIGATAPGFTLEDLDGKTWTLADFKGKNVVLEWYNPGCPYCRGVWERGLVKSTLDAMKKIDGDHVYLAVNSTGNVPKEQVIAQSRRLVEAAKLEKRVPVLIDHDGAVGHAYGARTTPHVFVIDAKGVLRYAGAYTNDPRGRDKDATNYVLNALEQIAAGESVAPDRTDPWGCGVKYAR